MSLQYLKFTYVDAVTGISVATEPAMNGTKFPAVSGIEFVWARESDYPTPVPEFFGTCPENAVTQVDGVMGVFIQQDWEQMRIDEQNAISKSLDIISLKVKSTVPLSSIGIAGDEAGMLAFDSTTMYYCTANYNGIDNIWVKQEWGTTGSW